MAEIELKELKNLILGIGNLLTSVVSVVSQSDAEAMGHQIWANVGIGVGRYLKQKDIDPKNLIIGLDVFAKGRAMYLSGVENYSKTNAALDGTTAKCMHEVGYNMAKYAHEEGKTVIAAAHYEKAAKEQEVTAAAGGVCA
jgi:hypothetical protein